jgi:hypothetical protein
MAYELLTAKTEVTEGTEIANAAADSIWCDSVDFKLNGERFEYQPAQPGLGANPGIIWGVHGQIGFNTMLAGSGTAGTAPKWGKLALAAGWAETPDDDNVVYSRLADPNTSKSLSGVWSDEGRLHKLIGSRGRLSINAEKGKPPMLAWFFRGISPVATARAPVVPADADFDDWTDAAVIQQSQTTFTLGGVALSLLSLTLDQADNVRFVDLPGVKRVLLRGDASYKGKIKALQPALGTFNPDALSRSNARLPFSLVHGVTPGNIGTVAGTLQLGQPTWSKVDEGDAFECDVFLVGATSGSTNDLTITLT